MTVSKVRLRTGQSSLWLEILVVVAITAIAVFLRYYQIGQVPPGFNSTPTPGWSRRAASPYQTALLESFHLRGSGFRALSANALFGPSIAAIRGTAAFAGVVGVVATYFATREIFRGTMGLSRARLLGALAALGLAVSLWHTQSSRVAFAAVGVPFLQVPGNYFLWRGMNTGRRVFFIISGVFLASLMYIYLSGSFAPFVYLFYSNTGMVATCRLPLSNSTFGIFSSAREWLSRSFCQCSIFISRRLMWPPNGLNRPSSPIRSSIRGIRGELSGEASWATWLLLGFL
jgi:hypothetical protein